MTTNMPTPYEVTYGEPTTYPRTWIATLSGGRTIVYVGPNGDGAPVPMTDARRLRIGRDLFALIGTDPAQISDEAARHASQLVHRTDDVTVRPVRTEHTIGDRAVTYGTDYTSRYGGGLWGDVIYRHL